MNPPIQQFPGNRCRWLALVSIVVLAAASVSAGSAGAEENRLPGDWEVTAMLVRGKLTMNRWTKFLADAELQKHRAVITGNTLAIKFNDREVFKGDYTLGSGKSAARITLKVSAGPSQGETLEGSYRLEEDTLTITTDNVRMTFRRAKR